MLVLRCVFVYFVTKKVNKISSSSSSINVFTEEKIRILFSDQICNPFIGDRKVNFSKMNLFYNAHYMLQKEARTNDVVHLPT